MGWQGARPGALPAGEVHGTVCGQSWASRGLWVVWPSPHVRSPALPPPASACPSGAPGYLRHSQGPWLPRAQAEIEGHLSILGLSSLTGPRLGWEAPLPGPPSQPTGTEARLARGERAQPSPARRCPGARLSLCLGRRANCWAAPPGPGMGPRGRWGRPRCPCPWCVLLSGLLRDAGSVRSAPLTEQGLRLGHRQGCSCLSQLPGAEEGGRRAGDWVSGSSGPSPRAFPQPCSPGLWPLRTTLGKLAPVLRLPPQPGPSRAQPLWGHTDVPVCVAAGQAQWEGPGAASTQSDPRYPDIRPGFRKGPKDALPEALVRGPRSGPAWARGPRSALGRREDPVGPGSAPSPAPWPCSPPRPRGLSSQMLTRRG